ncbi:ABC transporter substrate-binding protein, partial [Thermodesulfobacteriota bacterium]
MKKEKVFRKLILCGFVFFIIAPMMAFGSDQQAKKSKPSEIKHGGILRISAREDPLTLGFPPTQKYQPSAVYVDSCLETLARFDKTGAPVPWLATGWKTDTKAKTITLTLRKGVKFHDGTDFNAKAVKWNLDKCKAAHRGELTFLKSTDVIDNYTVRLNLSRMDSLLISNMAMTPGEMISPTAWEKAGSTDDERDSWCEKNPVSTGPFKFV